MISNKKLGTNFENEFAEILNNEGFWAHLVVPSVKGSQPFDVIASKNNIAYAFDCKTTSNHRFSYDRLEDNQRMAYKKWRSCGNKHFYIAIKRTDTGTIQIFHIAELLHDESMGNKSVNIREWEDSAWEEWRERWS